MNCKMTVGISKKRQAMVGMIILGVPANLVQNAYFTITLMFHHAVINGLMDVMNVLKQIVITQNSGNVVVDVLMNLNVVIPIVRIGYFLIAVKAKINNVMMVSAVVGPLIRMMVTRNIRFVITLKNNGITH